MIVSEELGRMQELREQNQPCGKGCLICIYKKSTKAEIEEALRKAPTGGRKAGKKRSKNVSKNVLHGNDPNWQNIASYTSGTSFIRIYHHGKARLIGKGVPVEDAQRIRDEYLIENYPDKYELLQKRIKEWEAK